jgi:vancomycin resistance protein YoaR
VVATVIAAVAGLYLGAQAWAGSAAPDGATVLGLDVSGLPAGQVREQVQALAADVNGTPITVAVELNSTEVVPATAGLEMNGAATANKIVGFSLDPGRIVARLWGGGEVQPVVTRDADAVTQAVAEAARVGLDQEAVEATVSMDGPEVEITTGQPRIAVDVDATATEVLEGWPSTAEFAAVATVESPQLTTEEAVRFQKAMNEYVFAEDVTLTSPNGDVVLTPEALSEYTGYETQEGRLILTVDGPRLARDLRTSHPHFENSARDATLGFDSAHMLVVDPGQPARVIDDTELEAAAIAAASSITRSGPIPFIETPPTVTAESIDLGDFTHRISSFTTPFTPREPKRERNITNAANRMSGTIIEPGEVFSLADAIGPVDGAHGYVNAGAIISNVHTEAMGGGLSQMATTAYNAGYFAGLEDVQHRPHSEWFARYPAGREATLFLPSLDMKFRNDTPYAILVNAYVENASVTVDLWSTPYYTVETVSSGKYNVRNGGTQYSDDPACQRQGASQGFTITNTRYVYLEGELVKEEPFTWTYRAVPAIVCT